MQLNIFTFVINSTEDVHSFIKCFTTSARPLNAAMWTGWYSNWNGNDHNVIKMTTIHDYDNNGNDNKDNNIKGNE